MKKRGIVIGDTHCGHLTGLTPPAYMIKERKGATTKRNKWASLQRELWTAYTALLDRWGPFHFGLFAGDAIDGHGEQSGGSELVTPDIDDQIDMAVECMDQVRLHAARGFKWVSVYGTPYHTGKAQDHENAVAQKAGVKKIGSHEWIDVNGCVFDLRHKVGPSGVPHSRHTAVARQRLWNVLWAERELVPKANVVLRAHVHYHNFCGGPGWVAMTLPALQGMGTKYGSRQCDGLVDWGAVVFDVDSGGAFDWHSDVVLIEAQKAKVIKI